MKQKKNVQKFKENMKENNINLDLLVENELAILNKCDYAINLFSSYEIIIIYFMEIFDDFDINLISSNTNNPISQELFQVCLTIFNISLSAYEIFSQFPESVILISSIYYIIDRESEFIEDISNKKFKLCVNNDINEIERCAQSIKDYLSKKYEDEQGEEDGEDQVEEKNPNFFELFENSYGTNEGNKI